ncbi:MAG: hypothetical protein WA989_02380 [Henriciella sp.]|uniref:hypothetical protein n=1 Tax=Henriciella sp. TaxID=1968823 RepID=UPI003C784F7A
MTLNIDYLLAGVAVAVVGGGALTLAANSSSRSQDLETRFSEADFATFNRGFEVNDTVCEVGLAKHDLCFEPSPLSAQIERGEEFPEDMYPLALEWRAKLAMPRKPKSLKTIRIGRTIALMERDSETIIDTMRLGETTFVAANETPSG